MSDEQVVTVEVDVPAEDGTPDPAAEEAAGDTEQQQDDGKHDSGSEDELETGGKKHFKPLPHGTEIPPSIVCVSSYRTVNAS